MRKFLSALMVAASFLLAGTCAAADENNPALVEDLKQNPANYIVCGGASTSGGTYYVDKNSLNVLKYAPPDYIIAVNLVYREKIGETAPETARYVSTQFSYDFDDKRIYVKRMDRNGAAYWIFIDPRKVGKNDGDKNGWSKDMAASEIAFYLAYNMSFFDKPVSELAQKYITSR